MSFLKSLFGRKSEAESGEAKPTKTIEYEGYTIYAMPYRAEGQYQTAGLIEKEIAGERKEHKFVRAERHASIDEATEFSLVKGRQIVDQVGERMFR